MVLGGERRERDNRLRALGEGGGRAVCQRWWVGGGAMVSGGERGGGGTMVSGGERRVKPQLNNCSDKLNNCSDNDQAALAAI